MVESAADNSEADRDILFGTPIFARQWDGSDELNARLTRLILEDYSQEDRRKNSNAGGWQTRDDLFSRNDDGLRQLKSMVDRVLCEAMASVSAGPVEQLNIEFRIDAWANVTSNGGYNIVHSHPNALWSGVYYVAAGGEVDQQSVSGKIEFLDPRIAVDHFQLPGLKATSRQVFANRPGLMLVFPGWLKHMVHPHSGWSPRISIAFNVVPIMRSGR